MGLVYFCFNLGVFLLRDSYQRIFNPRKYGRTCFLRDRVSMLQQQNLEDDSIISVIIPTYNEAKSIKATLHSVYSHQDSNIEVILSDGGSKDNTIDLAIQSLHSISTPKLPIKVISCGKSRADSLNVGAACAKGQLLLFLHADTQLPPCWAKKLRHAFKHNPKTVLSSFSFQTDSPRSSWTMRVITDATNVRSNYAKMPYGDQAICVRKDIFQSLGE